MNRVKSNKSNYMDEYYKIRENLSLKYINMPLNDMKTEIKKSVDECISQIEKIRSEKNQKV